MLTRALGSKVSFEEKAMAVVSNPLASYKMIRRFAFKLPEAWKKISEDMEEGLFKINDFLSLNRILKNIISRIEI